MPHHVGRLGAFASTVALPKVIARPGPVVSHAMIRASVGDLPVVLKSYRSPVYGPASHNPQIDVVYSPNGDAEVSDDLVVSSTEEVVSVPVVSQGTYLNCGGFLIVGNHVTLLACNGCARSIGSWWQSRVGVSEEASIDTLASSSASCILSNSGYPALLDSPRLDLAGARFTEPSCLYPPISALSLRAGNGSPR